MHTFDFSIHIPQPFSFELTVRKPAGWSWGAPSEVLEDNAIFTATRLPDWRLIGIKLEGSKEGAEGVAYSNERLSDDDKRLIVRLVEVGLGAHDDVKSFYSLADKDPLVKQLKEDLFGMRLGFLSGVFERAMLAICLQMAPIKRSQEMWWCLTETYGETAKVDGRRVRYWPTPAVVTDASVEELKQRCRLGYRAKAIHRVAEQMLDGFPGVLDLVEMGTSESLKLIQGLYGIGSYSAQIVSPFRGFPLDVWSSRIFHEIFYGVAPEDPRAVIKQVTQEATRRWGDHAGHVFVYVLNDLPNLSQTYPITRIQ